MSSNDVIVLQANFETWKQRASELKGFDPWLYYCVEQFVKPFALTDEEIQYGITDGSNDGGVDAIYFLVNQRHLVQEDTELEPKSVSRVRLLFIQVKTSGGFKTTEIDKLVFLTDDFLDLSKPATSFSAKYNSRVLEIMRTFKEKYLQISGSFPEVAIDYYYITGDDVTPDTKAHGSADGVKMKARSHLSKAGCQFHFINAEALWEQVQRRPPRDKMLTWSETPMQTSEGYVGLVKLQDYYAFLQDDPEVLAERIFESNVRGYQQDTPVNVQIRQSLSEATKANFWLLNNGITIIASKANNAGHRLLSIQDPQIVNGLQTSREVFSYFFGEKPADEKRSILVGVIETNDGEVRDLVIKATNSQNRMPPASLRMTDQIHRKIEDLFKQYDLYYDRRRGFYKDQGKPIHKIISFTALAQSVISVLLQRPDDARARPGDYFKDDERYTSIFGEEHFPLPVYLNCTLLLKRTEQFLESLEIERGDKRNLLFYVAAVLACELTQESMPSPEKLLGIGDISALDNKTILPCYNHVRKIYDALGQTSDKDAVARGPELVKRVRAQMKKRFSLKPLKKVVA